VIRFIVFDLDGTLVDSRRDIADAANALLGAVGGVTLPEEAIGRMVGDGAAALIARAFTAAKIAQPSDALDRFLVYYRERLLIHTRPYAGVEALLASLARRGPLAVLTNKPLGLTVEILKGLGLAGYFPDGRVLGGDGPLPRKPDPAALEHLASQAGVAVRHTLLVGDSGADWYAARAAGARACVARYGFGFVRFPVEELSPDDWTIDAPVQLLERLAGEERSAALWTGAGSQPPHG
jgi:phosphoglycolate phosphatase